MEMPTIKKSARAGATGLLAAYYLYEFVKKHRGKDTPELKGLSTPETIMKKHWNGIRREMDAQRTEIREALEKKTSRSRSSKRAS